MLTPPSNTPSPPLSPYSATRAAIRSLTLPPTIPSLPPSPTGTEPTALTQKFTHFLELKRSGVHFNEKLLRSSTLHNPRLLEKLLTFVGVENSYVSNLPKDLWDPKGFPKEASFEELAKRQQEVAAARAAKEKERERIEFVAAGSGQGRDRDRDRDRYAGSAAERVMRGLDRERRSTPPETGKRRERDRERDKDARRREEDVKRRRRSKSRSRSRSRERERDGGRYRDYYDSRR